MEKYVLSPEQEEICRAAIEPIKALFTPPFEIEEALTVMGIVRPIVLEFAPAATVEEYHAMLLAVWGFYERELHIIRTVDDLLTWKGLPPLVKQGAEFADGPIFKLTVERLLIPQSAILLAKHVG